MAWMHLEKNSKDNIKEQRKTNYSDQKQYRQQNDQLDN